MTTRQPLSLAKDETMNVWILHGFLPDGGQSVALYKNLAKAKKSVKDGVWQSVSDTEWVCAVLTTVGPLGADRTESFRLTKVRVL